ncbi:MAG: FAD/NAD(P)-binding protein [Desulfobacterales bacterium]
MSQTPDLDVQAERAFYRPQLAQVLAVVREPNHAVIELALPDRAELGHRPGQFVQVSVFGIGEAPISLCSSPTRSSSFQLCVRPVGNVSRALCELSADDWVGIRGPYGRGYFPVEAMQGRDVLILAGGIGLAPLRSLINYIRDRRSEYGRLVIVYGAKTPAAILFRAELETWRREAGTEVIVTVDEPDENWQGRAGVLTEPLKEEVRIEVDRTFAAVTGPPVMYKFAILELYRKGLPADRIYVSLERHFRCGIGKCGHCQLNDLYVCQNGPVFCLPDLLERPEAVETGAPDEDQD